MDYTNCEVPRYWYVAYTGDDQDDSDTPSYIEVGLEVENLGDGGLCEKVLEDGAALVGMFSELFSDYRSLEALRANLLTGMVNGLAGDVFSLGSLFCSDSH